MINQQTKDVHRSLSPILPTSSQVVLKTASLLLISATTLAQPTPSDSSSDSTEKPYSNSFWYPQPKALH